MNSSFKRKALLFLLLIGLFFAPFQASAEFGESVRNSAMGAVAGCIGALYLGLGLWGCLALSGVGAVGGGSDAAGAKIIEWITDTLDYIGEFVFGVLLPFAAALLSYSVALSTAKVTDFQPIIDGAAVATSLANLLLIAVLIIISIATIVGVETYGVKQRLPLLIGVVLIVNFSTIIVGTVVDAGNTILRFFYSNSAFATTPIDQYVVRNMKLSSTLAQESVATIQGILAARGSAISKRGAQVIKAALYGATLYLAFWALYLFLYLAYLFLMRIGVFWILIISAPVAFIAGILPVGQNYLERWWRELFRWSFIGPILLFLFFFGVIIWTQLNIALTGSSSSTSGGIILAPVAYAAEPDLSGRNLRALSIFIVFPIVGLFFHYAISLSKKAANAFSDVGVSGARTLLRSAGDKGKSVIGVSGKAGVNNYLLSSPKVGQLGKRLERSRFGKPIGKGLSNAHQRALNIYAKPAQIQAKAWEGRVAGWDGTRLERELSSGNVGTRHSIALAALQKNIPFSQTAFRSAKKIAPLGSMLERELQNRYLHYDAGFRAGGKPDGELDLAKIANHVRNQRITSELMLAGTSLKEQTELAPTLGLVWNRADMDKIARERADMLNSFQQVHTALGRQGEGERQAFYSNIARRTGRTEEEVRQALDQQAMWLKSPQAQRAGGVNYAYA